MSMVKNVEIGKLLEDGMSHSICMTDHVTRPGYLVGVITYGIPERPADCVILGRYPKLADAEECFDAAVALVKNVFRAAVAA